MPDYIPVKEELFLDWTKQLYSYALANYAKWNVPNPQQALESFLNAFETAFQTAQNPNHGKIDMLHKREARVILKKKVRVYVKAYLISNPALTNEDKAQMGLPIHDSTPTHHPPPDIKPEAEAVPDGRGKHRVTAINPQTRSKQKPDFVHGIAFAHLIRLADEPKASAEFMPSEFQSGAEKSFQWKESDYGKVVDYAVAYENAGGKRGPWSDVVSLIIA